MLDGFSTEFLREVDSRGDKLGSRLEVKSATPVPWIKEIKKENQKMNKRWGGKGHMRKDSEKKEGKRKWRCSKNLNVKQTDRQTDRLIDTQTDTQKDRQKDTRTDRQTDTRTDRQTDRQRKRQTDIQTDKQTSAPHRLNSIMITSAFNVFNRL